MPLSSLPSGLPPFVFRVTYLFLALAVPGGLAATARAQIQKPVRAVTVSGMEQAYGKLPLAFEENRGQAGPKWKYLSRGVNSLLLVGEDETVLAVRRPAERRECGVVSDLLRMRLLDGRGAPVSARIVRGEKKLPGVVNTLIGRDPKQWRIGAETYERVRVAGAYPGIDLVYYGNQRRLEYDFVVAPGADPARIRFELRGGQLEQKASGELAVKLGGREVVFGKPVVYQLVDGQRRVVEGRFALLGRSRKGVQTVGFALGRYDRERELVIDPVLSYSTYINGVGGPSVSGIAVDTTGEVFLTGAATAITPTAGAFQSTDNNNTGYGGNAYVMKLNATGTGVIYATYLGGQGGFQILPPPYAAGDAGTAIAVDSSGNAYLTGFTYSQDFPTMNPVQAQSNGVDEGNGDAFVTELNPTGTGLVYSTYLGGSGDAGVSVIGTGIAVDGTGATYVAGNTISQDFPTTPGAFQSGGPIFLAKLAPNGTKLVYSTTLGAGYVTATGMAIDGDGAAYVTGSTFPQNGGGIPATPGAYQGTNHSAYQSNAFVAKLNPTGTALGYATYLGGSGTSYTNGTGNASYTGDAGNAIAVDSSGNAYVTGSAGSEDFPITSGALQPNNVAPPGGTNVFVTKINPTGTALVYSTYLGGTGSPGAPSTGYGDQGNAIVVDTAGDAYVAGSTGSADFPVTTNAYQSTNAALANNQTNAFVSKLNPAGSGLLYSTYLGGSGTASASTVVVDSTRNIYIGGGTSSSDFPTTTGAFETTGNGGFVSKLDPAAGSDYALSITPATLEVFASQVGSASNATPVTITNIGSGNVTISGISIAGTNAAEFTQTNACGMLAPNDTCTVSVIFTPTTAGKQTATLSIADNAGNSPQSVALVGNETVYPPDPVLSPTQLTFAPQAVGSTTTQTVTLTNQGNGALTISSVTFLGQWWTQTNDCGTTLAAGASCTFNLAFTPTFGGSTTTYLQIADNANSSPQVVTLRGSGVTVNVGVSPSALYFAPLATGSTSPAQTVTVSNSSRVPITFSSVTATGDFGVTNNCLGPVASGSSCTVMVTFKPTASGIRMGTLTVSDGAINQPLQVHLTGCGPPITLSPTALTFAPQGLGTQSDTQVVTVANTGQGASYSISSIVVSGDFVWVKDLNLSCEGVTLGVYGSCNVEVAFKPTVAGTRTGTLTVMDNATSSPQTVILTGTGDGPAGTLSVATLSFTQQAVGSTSAAQTVVLTNSGTVALKIASVAASGDFAQTNTCGTSLAAGANCMIAVTFTPTAAGTRSGMLTVTDNATGSPQMVTLSGMGVAPAVTLSTATLSYAQQIVGAASAAQTVTLTNNGQAALTINSIAASGDFAETNTCGTSVAAGANCMIAVIFTPTATGTRSGSLTITDNAAGSPQTVALSGSGVTPVPAVTLAPGTLTFSAQTVGSTSAAQTVTLTNSGQAALTIASITATGDFAETNTCGSSLGAGLNCSIAVTFTPTVAGSRTGTLTITDDAAGSPQTVALSGAGASVGVTVSASSLTINAAGGSATDTITLSSLQGFSGTVALSCTVQPVGTGSVHDLPLCTLNPTQAQVANGSPVSATLTVSTTAANNSARPAAAFLGGGLLLTGLLFGGASARRRRLCGRTWLVLLLGLGLLGMATGCGGHSSKPSDPGTTAGSYTVTVTATGTSDAKVTGAATISLTLQ